MNYIFTCHNAKYIFHLNASPRNYGFNIPIMNYPCPNVPQYKCTPVTGLSPFKFNNKLTPPHPIKF
jgi:hypothetical protein